jgi:predicted nucleic acid-binding protein
MKQRIVLDAWAVLALLQKEEPAASRVRQLIQDAQEGSIELYISLVNLGEVYYRIGRVKGEKEARETLEEVRRLPLTFVPVTEEIVFAAASLKVRYAISYADAFAAATADRLDAAVATGDPEFAQLEECIQIEKLERREKT